MKALERVLGLCILLVETSEDSCSEETNKERWEALALARASLNDLEDLLRAIKNLYGET